MLKPTADPQLLCVSPEHFAEQLNIISRNYTPLSLTELSEALRKKKVPNNAIVLTFDDGYVDNLVYAKPLLEQYKIPATIFVTTGLIDTNQEPWWDEIERIVSLDPSWDVTQGAHNEEQKRYINLHKKLKPLDEESREKLLTKLANEASVPRSHRRYYRIVNAQELKELSQSPYIEIGSHTITHPELAQQTPERQKYEIFESNKTLENILGKSIISFSYPFGTKEDIGPRALEIVKQNYQIATANFPGYITKKSNRFLLTRNLVRNWNGTVFHNKLRGWLV